MASITAGQKEAREVERLLYFVKMSLPLPQICPHTSLERGKDKFILSTVLPKRVSLLGEGSVTTSAEEFSTNG